MKKSSSPKISVIMSVHNGMPFLTESVESILKQTYSNFEFLIVDDYSTDDSWKYITSIKDKRVVPIKNSRNLGLANSLNKTLGLATGKYIARMDADDVSLPERLRTQFDFMERNPKCIICGCWVKLIDESGKVIGKVHYPTSNKGIKKTLRRTTPIIHPTWFVKAVEYKKIGYKSKWDYVEDYEFLLRARKFCMENVNKELLLWRSQQNRRSRKSLELMYRKNLKLKLEYFIERKLDFYYLPYIIRSLLVTFLIPTNLKVYINKRAGLL